MLEKLDRALAESAKAGVFPILGICHRCGDETIVKEERFSHLVCKECRNKKPKPPILKEFRQKRGRPPEFDHLRVQPMVERYRAGESYEAIGQSFGLTRERIRQLLIKELGYAGHKALRREHSATLMSAKAEVKRETFLGSHPITKCAVCWAPTRRKLRPGKTRTTCSKRCAHAWQLARHRMDDGEHREHVARWAIRHPDATKAAQLAWANRYRAGLAKEGPKRPQENSVATEIMKWVTEARVENSRFWGSDGELIKVEMDGSEASGE